MPALTDKLSYHISTHAPRTGSDCFVAEECRIVNYFNPRSPHGERPVLSGRAPVLIYFNPRSPHGERLVLNALLLRRLISTHAPRTGSDADGI